MTDFSELHDLEADLRQAGITAGLRAAKAVEESAQRIEDDARANAPRKRLPHYARTITHDVTIGGGMIVGEIGPDREVNPSADLFWVLEVGRSHSAPRPHLWPAADREEPKFVQSIERIGGEIL